MSRYGKPTDPRRISSLGAAVGVLVLIAACQASGPSTDPETAGEDLGDLGDLKGDGDATTGDGDAACAQAETSAQLIPTNLLFVVDKSGSMKCNAPPTDLECLLPEKKVNAEPSKWESTQAALVGPDDVRTARDEAGLFRKLVGLQGLSTGLITFPIDSRCEILPRGALTTDIAPLDDDQLNVLQAALDLAPEGETPLAGATIRGLDVLRERLVAGEITGNSYLVLMTDGVETCQPAALEDLKEYVPIARREFDIRTYVIGAPGSEASRALLSELAHLGGTATTTDCDYGSTSATEGDCHVDLTNSEDFAGDLARVFTELAQSTQGNCDIDVPENALVDPNKVNVEFNPGEGGKETIYYDERDCGAEADGWQYTSGAKEKVVLCGSACERLRADPNARLKVVFGCEETLIR